MSSITSQGSHAGTQPVQRKGLHILEACLYVGNISKSTMYRLMAEGRLPSYVIGNRRYFLISELDSFLEKQSTLSQRGWS